MTTGLVCNKGLINGDRAVGETRRRPPHHARPFLIRIDLKSDGLSPAPLITLITNRETAFRKKIIFTRRTERDLSPYDSLQTPPRGAARGRTRHALQRNVSMETHRLNLDASSGAARPSLPKLCADVTFGLKSLPRIRSQQLILAFSLQVLFSFCLNVFFFLYFFFTISPFLIQIPQLIACIFYI